MLAYFHFEYNLFSLFHAHRKETDLPGSVLWMHRSVNNSPFCLPCCKRALLSVQLGWMDTSRPLWQQILHLSLSINKKPSFYKHSVRLVWVTKVKNQIYLFMLLPKWFFSQRLLAELWNLHCVLGVMCVLPSRCECCRTHTDTVLLVPVKFVSRWACTLIAAQRVHAAILTATTVYTALIDVWKSKQRTIHGTVVVAVLIVSILEHFQKRRWNG